MCSSDLQKNVIITKNGKNVYPEEIEANLQMHNVILVPQAQKIEHAVQPHVGNGLTRALPDHRLGVKSDAQP